MDKVDFCSDEINKKEASELSKEILGIDLIRALIRLNDGTEVSNNIVYDFSNDEFDYNIVDSLINESTRAVIAITDRALGLNFPNKIPYKDGDVVSHASRVQQQSLIARER